MDINVKNVNCILIWFTLLAIIISTVTAITTDHETDETLNTNQMGEPEEVDPEFDNSNIHSMYGLRINPKYYGILHQLMDKRRIKGSEFLGKRMGSEFLGKRSDNSYNKIKKMGSEFLGRRRRSVSDIKDSHNRTPNH